MSLNRRTLSKVQGSHFCKVRGAVAGILAGGRGVAAPTEVKLFWRPVEVVSLMFPETERLLRGLQPAVAGYCKPCGELWVVMLKEMGDVSNTDSD